MYFITFRYFVGIFLLLTGNAENNLHRSLECRTTNDTLLIDSVFWNKHCQNQNANCIFPDGEFAECSSLITRLKISIPSSERQAPDMIFQHLPNINNFEIIDQNMTSMPWHQLGFANNLQVLNFSGNNLREFWFVNPIINLKYLNLSRNSLTSISSLSNFHLLVELDVSANVIDSIDQNTFSTMMSLEKLVLRGNRLKQFSIVQLGEIKYMDISYNQLMLFQINGSLPQIKDLILDGNTHLILSDAYVTAKAPRLKNLSIQNTKYECNPFLSASNTLALDSLSVVEQMNSNLLKTVNITANFSNGTCQCGSEQKILDLDRRVSSMERQMNKAIKILETLHYKITGFRSNH